METTTEGRSAEQLLEPGLSNPLAENLAASFKALSDPNRLRLISLLAENGEMCVCDFPEVLGVSQPTVSHHLKVLTNAGLLTRSKRGRWAFFRIAEPAVTELMSALQNALPKDESDPVE